MDKIFNYIDGEFSTAIGKNWLDNYNPSSGSVYNQIPDSNEKDIALAEKAAQSAFSNWSKTSLKERSAVLLRIAELITKNLDDLALAECIDNGKPLALAKKVDIPRAAANMSFFATAILHENSDAHEMNQVASCWLYFTLEFAALLVYLENSTCSCCRKYRSSQTF